MSYWNRPFFPEWCGDAIMDDHVTYDTTVRIGGSFSGIAEAFKVIAGYYGWTHIVLVSDDDDTAICWYGGRPLNEILSNNENYTFTWLRFGSDPTDEQLDDILEQTRARTRGTSACYVVTFHSTHSGDNFPGNWLLISLVPTTTKLTTTNRKYTTRSSATAERARI